MRPDPAFAREIEQRAAPVLAQFYDSTRRLNAMFMDAWRRGYLDALWDEMRPEFPNAWLHYFIRARGLGDIKIGKTNHMASRFKTLENGASRGLDLLACYPAPITHEIELHSEFAHIRLNGEWFIGHSELLGHLRFIGSDVDDITNLPAANAHGALRHHRRRAS